MANVLPQDFQKRIWSMYRSRLVLVFALVLMALAAAAALTLIPSYVALQVAAPPVSQAAAAEDPAREDAIALERSQFLVQELKPILASTSSPSDVLRTALGVKPAGVRVTRIIFAASPESQLTIIGAGTRENVSAYKDALAATGAFDGVSVPVGALVNAEGGGFSIVLTGTF